MSPCQICGGSDFEVAYAGKVRMGRFGQESEQDHELPRCLGCGSISLPNLMGQLDNYYETDAYRLSVDGAGGRDHFISLHDAEQPHHLSLTGMDHLRHKVVADIGCGAGAFLDLARGLAQDIIAVEPNKQFRESLSARGYHTFDYASQAKEWQGKVDTVTCFSVLEHIADPLSFLKDLRQLVRPNGQLVLTTPNAKDFLLETLPTEFGAFFYRQAHLWYWDAASLAKLLSLAGFDQIQVVHDHRYGLSNFLNWVQHHRPMGQTRLPYVSQNMDDLWKREREQSETSDYLTVYATVAE